MSDNAGSAPVSAPAQSGSAHVESALRADRTWLDQVVVDVRASSDEEQLRRVIEATQPQLVGVRARLAQIDADVAARAVAAESEGSGDGDE